MLTVQEAFRIASEWTRAAHENDTLDAVIVEATRVYATDGHRAIVLSVEAKPDEIGVFYGNVRSGRRATDFVPAPIDNVIPERGAVPAAALNPASVEQLRVIVGFIRPRTYANLHLSAFGGALDVEAIPTQKEAEALRKRPHTSKKPPRHSFLLLGVTTAPHHIVVNVHYLLDAIDALGFDDQPVELHQAGELDTIRLDGPNGLAVIMPVRR